MPKIIIELTDEQYEKYNNALNVLVDECIEHETMGGVTLRLDMFSIWNRLVVKTHRETDLGEVDINFEP